MTKSSEVCPKIQWILNQLWTKNQEQNLILVRHMDLEDINISIAECDTIVVIKVVILGKINFMCQLNETNVTLDYLLKWWDFYPPIESHVKQPENVMKIPVSKEFPNNNKDANLISYWWPTWFSKHFPLCISHNLEV